MSKEFGDKKQSRLPFKVLDVKKTLQTSSVQLKKRKISDNETSVTSNKVSKKEEENIDIANLGGTPIPEIIIQEKSLTENNKKEQFEKIYQNKDCSSSSGSENKECAINIVEINLSDSDQELYPINNISKSEDGKEESEMDFSRTETSELDASVIFNQGSQLGESSSTALPKQKKRVSPMNPKKLEEMEKRKQEKLRLRAERERQLQESRDLKKKQKDDEKLQRDQKKQEEKQKKLKELEEKKIKDQQERDEKLRQKQEKKDKDEQERLEKLKIKEEERLKKIQVLNEKQDEKKRKEEERIKKLEEKKKAEEEEERKKEKEKAVFAKFFIKNESSPPSTQSEDNSGIFKPFEVMKNMTVASVVPDVASNQFNKEYFEASFKEQDLKRLYLEELKSGIHTPLCKKQPSWKTVEVEDIVLIENDQNPREKHKAKFFQFNENVRPPYYGTWLKTSRIIKARNPFAQDTVFFDYEVDSDEEWEEGGPGENLSDTDNDKESEDDYEVDNEFFVPHGYLSADEEKDDELGVSPENLQKRLKMRQLEFQEELKKKCSEMKPRVLGCFWICENNPRESSLMVELKAYSMVTLVSLPIITFQSNVSEDNLENQLGSTPTGDQAKSNLKKVPKEAMPYIIKLIHGNTNRKPKLLKEFQQFWLRKTLDEGEDIEVTLKDEKSVSPLKEKSPDSSRPNISKRQLEMTFQKISSWMRCPDPALNKFCWWVHEDFRNEYNCLDLPIPNQWTYITQKDPEPSPTIPKSNSPVKNKLSTPNNSTPSIRKFAKTLPRLTLTPENRSNEVKINLNKSINSQTTLPTASKAVLTNTNILQVPKPPRKIVPITLVSKSKVKDLDMKPLAEKQSIQGEIETDEVIDISKEIETKTQLITSSPNIENYFISNCKSITNCVEPSNNPIMKTKNFNEDELKLIKPSADTPSILKYVKRIAPNNVPILKRPKLVEENIECMD